MTIHVPLLRIFSLKKMSECPVQFTVQLVGKWTFLYLDRQLYRWQHTEEIWVQVTGIREWRPTFPRSPPSRFRCFCRCLIKSISRDMLAWRDETSYCSSRCSSILLIIICSSSCISPEFPEVRIFGFVLLFPCWMVSISDDDDRCKILSTTPAFSFCFHLSTLIRFHSKNAYSGTKMFYRYKDLWCKDSGRFYARDV